MMMTVPWHGKQAEAGGCHEMNVHVHSNHLYPLGIVSIFIYGTLASSSRSQQRKFMACLSRRVVPGKMPNWARHMDGT